MLPSFLPDGQILRNTQRGDESDTTNTESTTMVTRYQDLIIAICTLAQPIIELGHRLRQSHLILLFSVGVIFIVTASASHASIFWLLILGVVLFSLTSILVTFPSAGPYPRLKPVRRSNESNISIMKCLSSRECKYPKDKSYALQAVLQRIEGKELPFPNASLTISETFRDLTLKFIHSSQSFDFLNYSGVKCTDESSSWVPKWEVKLEEICIQPRISDVDLDDATPKSHNYWTWTPDRPTILMVRGKTLGFVQHTYKTRLTQDKFDAQKREIHIENMKIIPEVHKLLDKSTIFGALVGESYFTDSKNPSRGEWSKVG
jgi:hypothetical protein